MVYSFSRATNIALMNDGALRFFFGISGRQAHSISIMDALKHGVQDFVGLIYSAGRARLAP